MYIGWMTLAGFTVRYGGTVEGFNLKKPNFDSNFDQTFKEHGYTKTCKLKDAVN